MEPRLTQLSRDELLDRLLDTIRTANSLQLDDLAYDLSVAVTEERLRMDTPLAEATDPVDEPRGQVIPFPS